LGKIIIDCEIMLRLLKWVEKVRNYGKWSKILGALEEGIFFEKNDNKKNKFLEFE
jgi:hypothetical protein